MTDLRKVGIMAVKEGTEFSVPSLFSSQEVSYLMGDSR
jgi:hypothetical protein